jgi:hypothetical protein
VTHGIPYTLPAKINEVRFLLGTERRHLGWTEDSLHAPFNGTLVPWTPMGLIIRLHIASDLWSRRDRRMNPPNSEYFGSLLKNRIRIPENPKIV